MKRGRRPTLDEETVRIVRRWYGVWTRIPKPQDVAGALGMSKSAMEQMAKGDTYKWVKP